jgi:hypothetical protein
MILSDIPGTIGYRLVAWPGFAEEEIPLRPLGEE